MTQNHAQTLLWTMNYADKRADTTVRRLGAVMVSMRFTDEAFQVVYHRNGRTVITPLLPFDTTTESDVAVQVELAENRMLKLEKYNQ